MFEDVKAVPKAAPQPAMPQPTPQPAPVAAHVFVDKAQAELFKRTSLTIVQKIGLVVLTIAVLGALVGGGIWLYFKLQPFSDTTSSQNNNNAVNSNVPLQELDSDRDGLRDIDERRYGTDPNKADTDDDGLTDYQEVTIYKTNPLKADTDGDGYTDSEEVTNGYDPNGTGKL